MGAFPEPLRRLIDALGQLPGVGPQTAERLAFHLLQADKPEAVELAAAINAVKEKLHPCPSCFAATPEPCCEICADSARDQGLILVVETERELAAFERMGRFGGVYQVLGGRASAAEGRRYAAAAIERLKQRVSSGQVREVILGTNPDKHGDLALRSVVAALQDAGVRITRLARGLPQGANIEYLGAPILDEALQERRSLGGQD